MLLILQSAKMEKGPMSLHSRDDIGMIICGLSISLTHGKFFAGTTKNSVQNQVLKINYLHCTDTSEGH